MEKCAVCGKEAEMLPFFLIGHMEDLNGKPVYDKIADLCEECGKPLQEQQEKYEEQSKIDGGWAG